ncbi:MAG: C-GCAxxG-C-C family (seleno)protein [Lachnospiraceae bacterium]|nr:C-GCAxxG-C-C family (seleno)protein [Lachnospiraceae bacterium]
MSKKAEKATELFLQGYNCSQAVFAAFSEDLGMDFETAVKFLAPFGGGMGGMREVCGAVSGMFAVAGMKYGYTDFKDPQAKAKHYKMVQKLADEFKAKNNSIICRELLGLENGVAESASGSKDRELLCTEFVKCAAEIIEKLIDESEVKDMKLVIPVENKALDVPVCPSFGRAPFFVIYNTENGEHKFIDNSASASQGGAGIKAAQMLADSGADFLITYRCGENAANVLNAADIKIYKAEDGSVAENIEKCKGGKLSFLAEIHPGFHNHGGANK